MTRQINLRVNDDLYDEIELARGGVPRERWIRQIVEAELHTAQPVAPARSVTTLIVPDKAPVVVAPVFADGDPECKHWHKHKERQAGQVVWVCNACGKVYP